MEKERETTKESIREDKSKLRSLNTSIRKYRLMILMLVMAAIGGCTKTSNANSNKPSICEATESFDATDNPENTDEFYENPNLPPCYDPEINSQIQQIEYTRIPLHFNILYYPNVDIEDIKDGIRRDIVSLNHSFAPANMDFYISGSTEVYDENLQEFIQDSEKDRIDLGLEYSNSFPPSEGYSIYYYPKTDWADGSAAFTTYIYYATPDFVQSHVRERVFGYSSAGRNLPHEIGHVLSLRHPFENDGLKDTINYYQVCDISPHSQLSYALETYVDEEGTCWAACPDDCNYKMPVNVMDYIDCTTDTNMDFSPGQLTIINCDIQNQSGFLTRFAGLDLPETEL